MNNSYFTLDLLQDTTCHCNPCYYQREYATIYRKSIYISIFLPMVWVVPIGAISYEYYLFKTTQNSNDLKEHAKNHVTVCSIMAATMIGFVIYLILASFIILPIISSTFHFLSLTLPSIGRVGDLSKDIGFTDAKIMNI